MTKSTPTVLSQTHDIRLVHVPRYRAERNSSVLVLEHLAVEIRGEDATGDTYWKTIETIDRPLQEHRTSNNEQTVQHAIWDMATNHLQLTGFFDNRHPRFEERERIVHLLKTTKAELLTFLGDDVTDSVIGDIDTEIENQCAAIKQTCES